MTSCAALSFRSEAHGCADSVAARSSCFRALSKASPHLEGHGDLLSRVVMGMFPGVINLLTNSP